MPDPIEEIDDQLDKLERAQTPLEELAAVDELWNVVDRLRRKLIYAASDAGYTGVEIARAAGGVTREAINKMLRRRAATQDRPAAGTSHRRRKQ